VNPGVKIGLRYGAGWSLTGAAGVCTAILFVFGLLCAHGIGQQADTAPLMPPPGPPPPVVFQNAIAATDLAFHAGDAGQPAKAVLNDKRFRAMLKEAIPRTWYHYGKARPVAAIAF